MSDKKWKKAQRDMLMTYKVIHIKQQANARIRLEALKKACCLLDSSNQPTQLLLFPDCMGKWASRTPILNGGDKVNEQKVKGDEKSQFENRICGVQVWCGDIQGEILVHTDGLIKGGANYMVEVVRRTLIEVDKMCHARGYSRPAKLNLQFDNCGENKNT